MSQNNTTFTTYVLRKDGKCIEYAHTLMCVNKGNPFVDLIRPVPINNPDTIINSNLDVFIRVYSNMTLKNGTITYNVTERSFR